MDITKEFVEAVKQNNINKVRDMIATAGASASQLVNSRSGDGRSSLHMAALWSQVDILNVLLDVPNVDINIRDNNDWTPIHIASINNKLEALVVLVQRGGDIHLRNNEGRTAMFYGHRDGHTRIIDYLVSQGATRPS